MDVANSIDPFIYRLAIFVLAVLLVTTWSGPSRRRCIRP